MSIFRCTHESTSWPVCGFRTCFQCGREQQLIPDRLEWKWGPWKRVSARERELRFCHVKSAHAPAEGATLLDMTLAELSQLGNDIDKRHQGYWMGSEGNA